MKKIISALLLVLIMSSTAMAAWATPIKLIVNGHDIYSRYGQEVIVRNDRTLVPVRIIAEENNYQVGWNGKTREVTLSKGDQTIAMTIGKKNYRINVENRTMDVAPMIYKDRTYLPARFVGEAMGLEVQWDAKNRCAIIGVYGKGKGAEVGKEEYLLPGTNLAVNLPEGARDQIVIRKSDYGSYEIVDKMHADQKNKWGGVVVFVSVSNTPDTNPIHHVLGYRDGKYAIADFPGDLSWDMNNRELNKSYEASRKLVDEILQSVHWVK